MDNKYANLPGIAKNEPDFYETPNINIEVKNEPVEDDTSDINIHKINISTKEAHDKFNTKIFNADFVDFSDTLTNRRKFGYVVEPDTFEWNQDTVETPLQRFKRLERELNELKTDLSTMSTLASEEEKNFTSFDPVELSKQVENLQKQINSLHLQSIGAKSDPSQLDNKVKKQLLIDHLNELKKSLNKKDSSKPAESLKTNESSAIVFKLFTDLEQVDLQRANKVAELNQRLANLEKVFGAGNGSFSESQINKLCTNIDNKTILGLVENLNSKLSLLEPQSLDQVESRLQLVTQRVNQLNEKKVLIEDQEKLNRINELYNMISNWKDLSTTVPAIVERLAALNEVHQKAFQFASMLSRLDNEQATIKSSVETSLDSLNQLKKSFEENLESIRSNFELLNDRILSIGK